MSNPIKKLLGQTAIYGMSSIISRTLNFFLVPFYLYIFDDPKDYGVISILYSFVAFLMVLLTFGMETAYFRFVQDESDKKKVFQTGFVSLLAVNIIFFIGIFLTKGSIADWIGVGEHPEYITLLGLIVVVDAASALPLAKLRQENQAKRFAFIQFSGIGVNVILNLVLLSFFFDKENPEEGVLIILIVNLISSLIKPLLCLNDFKNIEFKWDKELGKRMLLYAFPLVIAGFAGIVNETIDRILLLKYIPENQNALHEIGIYSANYKVAMLVSIVLQAYRYAAEPFFFNQKNNSDRNKTYIKLMNYFVAFVCLMFLVISLNLDIFKYFIPNKNYWGGLYVVPILLMANVFLGIYLNQSVWYKLSDKTKYGAYISVIGAILTIVINILFIPTYGYKAAAWATLIVYATQMTLSYFWGQKHFPIKYNRRKFALYLGSTVVFYFISQFISFENTLLSFLKNNLFVVLFILLVLKIEGISLKKMLKRA